MHVYLYIHNKYSQYTYIQYVNKNFILDAINHDELFDSTKQNKTISKQTKK